MAVVVQVQGAGLGAMEYDALQDEVDWENHPAAGGIFHVAWFDDDGVRVVDVWEREQDWEAFLNDRLLPAMTKLGVTVAPLYTVTPAHRYFNTESAHAGTAS